MNNMSAIPMAGGTFCLSKAGLAIGTTASKAKIAAPNGAGVDYCIDGVLYHKADTDDCVLFTDLTQSTLTTCLYVVCLDSSGTVSVVQGAEVLTADLTAKTAVLHFPTIAATLCPIGYIKLAQTGAFVGGTTLLSAGTVTDTYVDLFSLPARPLTA